MDTDLKAELRARFLKMRKGLSRETVEGKSAEIMNQIKKLLSRDDKVIMFYVPINNEVDLLPMVRELFLAKKTILFPKLINKDNIVPYIIYDLFFDFKPGAYNIPEPDTDAYMGTIDVVFVPGVVFDKNGFRIGYGKGYFDRFLSHVNYKRAVGVAYDFQVEESIPHTASDFPCDLIVTTQGVIQCKQNKG